MTEMKRSRRSLLRDAARVVAVGIGGLAGMSASAAKACAIYCRYQYTDNNMDGPCTFKRVFECTSACDGSTFDYCTTRSGSGFCLSQNVC